MCYYNLRVCVTITCVYALLLLLRRLEEAEPLLATSYRKRLATLGDANPYPDLTLTLTYPPYLHTNHIVTITYHNLPLLQTAGDFRPPPRPLTLPLYLPLSPPHPIVTYQLTPPSPYSPTPL